MKSHKFQWRNGRRREFIQTRATVSPIESLNLRIKYRRSEHRFSRGRRHFGPYCRGAQLVVVTIREYHIPELRRHGVSKFRRLTRFALTRTVLAFVVRDYRFLEISDQAYTTESAEVPLRWRVYLMSSGSVLQRRNGKWQELLQTAAMLEPFRERALQRADMHVSCVSFGRHGVGARVRALPCEAAASSSASLIRAR